MSSGDLTLRLSSFKDAFDSPEVYIDWTSYCQACGKRERGKDLDRENKERVRRRGRERDVRRGSPRKNVINDEKKKEIKITLRRYNNNYNDNDYNDYYK